jgi:integrase
MPSFRNPKAQAQHAVSQRLALNESRHDNRQDGRIHSVGTGRAYTESLSTFTSWLQDEKLGDLQGVSREVVIQYLELRTTEVSQAQLNKDRHALQSCLGERLPVLRSEVELVRGSKVYTPEQISIVQQHQSPKNQLASALVAATGIRAHELLCLMPETEKARSGHRVWRDDLHAGLTTGVPYVTTGKGGLVRRLMIPATLARLLESTRLTEPRIVIDRCVRYTSHYAVGGGHAWSQSFSAASNRALGWSAGGHAVRATWACNRVAELQSLGYSQEDAKLICSQNLGHFRADVLEYYIGR